MEAILLGTLGFLGNNLNKKNKKNINNHKPTVNKNYNNSINNIVKNQAMQSKTTGYANSFDSIVFDNMNGPVGLNEANIINQNGVPNYNLSLQRDLDFKNDYSEFANTQMHYSVVPTIELMTDNMNPNTAKRDLYQNKDNSHTLALHTGVDPFYMSKDSFDPIQMFEPKKDITFVNGAPVMTDKLEERYVPSSKNNFGDLPFEHNLHVLPGINGIVEEPNAVHRILPKTTNELRSKTNKKVTYNAEKIESGIRSALRANDLNITKFKKSNIKKNSTKNYLPNSSRNNKPSMTGKFRKPNTNRSVSKNVFGHINNSTRGNRRREKHSASSKISYADDSISRSVTNVNNKQFLANKSSYSNTPNERSNSSHNIHGNAHKNTIGSYSIDPKDIPLTTLRQMMIHGDTNIGITKNNNNNNYVFSKDAIIPQTIRSTTSHNTKLGSIKVNNNSYIDNNDPAKNTIRQTTEHMSIIGNANPDQHGSYSNNNNPAKNTIRQTTEHMSVLGTTKPDQYGLYVNNNDPAKETIKQTTEHMTVLGTANPDQYGLYVNNDDPARNTIKQTTEHMSIIGAADPNQHGLYIKNNDTAKNTIRQSTEHMTVTSNLQPSSGAPAYINYLDTPDTTIRNTTELNQYVSNNSRPEGKNPHMYNYDEKAKKTIKQTTLYPTQGGRMQNKANGIGYTRDLDDNAKPTIRQTTLHSTQGGRMQNKTDGIGYSRDLKDNAKITIKQTTLHSSQGGRIGANNKKSSYSIDNKDKARTTIKQTTILKNHIGPLGSNVEKHKNNQAEENMTIDERKQILTYNRFANKKSSNATPCINKKTLKLKEENYLNRENIGYKKESCNIDSLDKMFTRNKKILKDNKNYKITNYRINNDYIDTLKDNPFVNDLMHQKNIDDVETNFIY